MTIADYQILKCESQDLGWASRSSLDQLFQGEYDQVKKLANW